MKAALPAVLQYNWKTFHCVRKNIYPEAPRWQMAEDGPILSAKMRLQDEKIYVKQHPDIAFVYYNHYTSGPNTEISHITSDDGVFKNPEPSNQFLALVSEHMISAVDKMRRRVLGFSTLFSNFDPAKQISEPYLFMYYSLPLFEHVQPHLNVIESQLMKQLVSSVLGSYGNEHDEAQRLAAKGTVTRKLMKYLIQPGDVEAFKSRIQLALHHETLTIPQQRKVWRNFFKRAKELDESNIDFEDIQDHIDELAKENVNGRQIRNAITTARQLAQYQRKGFCYRHLKHVIEIDGEFEKYLRDPREGLTDDQIKKGEGTR